MKNRIFGMLALCAVISGCSTGPSLYEQTQEAYRELINKSISEGKSFLITQYGVWDVNSVGGVDVEIDVVNLSKKTIKYLTYHVTPYNAVGDVQRGEIKRISTMRLTDTGPYAAGAFIPGIWETLWYNSTIKCVVIKRIDIEYMDGAKKVISGPANVRRQAMPEGFVNSCEVKAS